MKSWTGKTILLLSSLVVMAILTDVALSVLIGRSRADLFEYTTETPRYKVMRADVDAEIYGVPFRTNHEGFRDSEHAIPEKEDDEYRIVLIGDSFSSCAGVPYEEIFSEVLEDKLRRDAPEANPRVINLACAGYNIVQYEQVLREVGLPLDPDLVVVAIYPSNDFDMSGYREHRAVAFGEQEPTLPSWLEQRYLYQIVVPRTRVLFRRLFRQPQPEPSARDLAQKAAARRENEIAISQIAAGCREHRVELITVLLPENSDYRAQVGGHEALVRFCQDNGALCLDTLDSFVTDGRSPVRFRINIVDSHPNGEYNAVVASALLAPVREVMSSASGAERPGSGSSQ